MKSIEDVGETPYARPVRRCKVKQKSDGSKKVSCRPRRKKRRPNKGSIDDECGAPASARTKGKRKKINTVIASNADAVVHDSAISRVIGSGSLKVGDFSAKEMICIINHLNLTPVSTRKK